MKNFNLSNTVKVYAKISSVFFQSDVVYKSVVYMQIMQQLIALVIQYTIWETLYRTDYNVFSRQNVSLDNIMNYFVISGFLSIIYSNSIILNIQAKCTSGDIAYQLIKPVKFKLFMFFESIGKNLSSVGFRITALIIVAILFFNVQLPSYGDALYFLLTFILGLIVYYQFSYLVGLLSFWYQRIWHFYFLFEGLMRIFSGISFPVWFFPKIMNDISVFLPFQYIYFIPISIYLGKMSHSQILYAIAGQIAWIVIFQLMERLMWRNAVKKIEINGG